MVDNRNQHFVPRCHLKPFTVDEAKLAINLFNVQRMRAIPSAPLKHQCSRDWFYGNDPRLEKAISTVEQPCSTVVRHLRGGGAVTGAVDIVLRRFMLLQNLRTETAARSGVAMAMAFHDLPGSDLPVPPPRERRLMAVHAAMLEFGENMRIVDDLKLRIVRNTTAIPFVTSDNPSVLTNRLHLQRRLPRWSFGVKTAGAILLMPLAPELLAILFDGAVHTIPHEGRRVDVTRAADVEALNEQQFLNLAANAYFADWECRSLVAAGALAAARRRPEERVSVSHAVLDSSSDWGERFVVEPPSDIRDGRKRLLHIRVNRPAPSAWPSVFRFRPDASPWSNDTGAGLTRLGCLEGGFVTGDGYRKVRV